MKIEGIKGVLSYNKINRKNLLALLKTEARLINIQDIIQASSFILNDAKYVREAIARPILKLTTLHSSFVLKKLKNT